MDVGKRVGGDVHAPERSLEARERLRAEVA